MKKNKFNTLIPLINKPRASGLRPTSISLDSVRISSQLSITAKQTKETPEVPKNNGKKSGSKKNGKSDKKPQKPKPSDEPTVTDE